MISKYSDHIGIPVYIQTSVRDEEGKETGEVKWEQINKAQALWTRSKSDVSDEEYQEFYKHVSHDFADPLTWSHNKVEGKTIIPAYCIFQLKHLGICTIVTTNMA
ncbi:hypothetical protein ACT691_13285 [Vibrio metschnikovii]